MPDEKATTRKELAAKLQEILVEGPLYRSFSYTGTECHYISAQHETGRDHYGMLPDQIRMYCSHEKCECLTWWEVNDKDVYFISGFVKQRHYTCRNCGQSRQNYAFIWQENKSNNVFMKIGQYPALSIEPSSELAKALGPDDTELYKKGLI